jgi:16S rRNA G966 N2-methylase RsmD
MEEIYDKMIKLISELPQDLVKMIIIEHMSALKLYENIGEYERIKSKKFGKTTLSYYGEEDEY